VEASSGNSALKFAAKEGGTAMEDTMDGLEGIEATGQPNSGTTVVQVSNIAPQATRDQMITLFTFVGKVEDCRLYPSVRDAGISITSRCAFVKFADPKSVGVTLHLNNTVFIDRAVIITPVTSNTLPDENDGLIMAMQVQQQQGSLTNGSGAGKPSTDAQVLAANPGLITPSGTAGQIATPDPNLIAAGLPPYPLLPCTMPVTTVEEIRRTVQVAGLDKTVSAQQCIDYLNEKAGEVKYFRFCTRAGDPVKYALAEFSDRAAVINALKLNGQVLGVTPLQVTHSTDAITKPITKSNEAAQREIEEAMNKVKEANCLVSAAVDPLIGMLGGVASSAALSAPVGFGLGAGAVGAGASLSARTTRSRSRDRHSRHRSRSPSHRHRRRSRSRSRRRSRSRDRHRRRRSRSRSRDRHRRRRSRSRSKDRRRRSRSRDRDSKSKRDRSSKDRDEKEEKEETNNENGDNGSVAGDNNGVDATVAAAEATEGEVKTEVEADSGKETRTRSRSKSPSRRRSRSRSREKHSRRRSRSRSRDRRRKRSRDRRRSRSRDRKRRSRSRDRKRSRSRESKKRSHRDRESQSPKRESSKVKPRDYDQEEAGYESKDSKRPPSPPAEIKEEPTAAAAPAEDIKREPDDMEMSNSP